MLPSRNLVREKKKNKAESGKAAEEAEVKN